MLASIARSEICASYDLFRNLCAQRRRTESPSINSYAGLNSDAAENGPWPFHPHSALHRNWSSFCAQRRHAEFRKNVAARTDLAADVVEY